jgi:hypothetical protein
MVATSSDCGRRPDQESLVVNGSRRRYVDGIDEASQIVGAVVGGCW